MLLCYIAVTCNIYRKRYVIFRNNVTLMSGEIVSYMCATCDVHVTEYVSFSYVTFMLLWHSCAYWDDTSRVASRQGNGARLNVHFPIHDIISLKLSYFPAVLCPRFRTRARSISFNIQLRHKNCRRVWRASGRHERKVSLRPLLLSIHERTFAEEFASCTGKLTRTREEAETAILAR